MRSSASDRPFPQVIHFWAVTFFTKYRTEFLPRSIRFTGDEGLFCATQSKWHPLTDHSFTPHNGCFSLNMYFILFNQRRIFLSVCTWKWNHFKVSQTFPNTCKKVKDFAQLFHFTTRGISSFALHKQTHYIFSSHISCIRILKDIIRLHAAQPHDKSSRCMANSTILRVLAKVVVGYMFYFSSRCTENPQVLSSDIQTFYVFSHLSSAISTSNALSYDLDRKLLHKEYRMRG